MLHSNPFKYGKDNEWLVSMDQGVLNGMEGKAFSCLVRLSRYDHYYNSSRKLKLVLYM